MRIAISFKDDSNILNSTLLKNSLEVKRIAGIFQLQQQPTIRHIERNQCAPARKTIITASNTTNRRYLICNFIDS